MQGNFQITMRKLFFTFLIAGLLTNCTSTEESGEKRLEEVKTSGNEIADIIRNPVTANGVEDSINVAKMQFEKDTFFFGTVKEGKVVNHRFTFTNAGEVPLLIHDARSTCGCTIPKWPKNPIAPGEKGTINVKFNTENKGGYQHKPVTILANTYPNSTVVHIVGEVKK